MRARVLRFAPLAALAALIAPLVSDAGIPVPPASKAPACATVDRPLPTPDGDEQFFNIPGGVPNVMLLLDNSGSMLELPNDPPLPSSWPSSGGTCSVTGWVTACTTNTDCQTMLKSSTATCNSKGLCQNTVPYDNGFSTAAVTDNPPWGLTKCTTSAEPTGDKVSDACLFRPNSTYKINFSTGGNPLAITGESRLQTTASAPVYNSHPCAAVDSSGNLIYNRSGTLVQASNVSECTSCLASAGYYLFKVTYTDSSNNSQTVYNLAAKGSFMNAYPPKYIAARKVVKDLAKIDPLNTSTVDQMRLGLTVFTSGTDGNYSTSLRANDGGVLVVPLGPNCDDSVPASVTKYTPARQAIIDAINNTSRVSFQSNTPLAETLFNIGQYFSASKYSDWFGSSWVRSSFNSTAAGSVNASWVSTGRQDAFCWMCQQSSVIVITDGEPNFDSNLPKNPTPSSTHTNLDYTSGNLDFRKWSNPTIDCPACGSDMSYSSVTNALHKVAYFLNQTDLRPDLDDRPRKQTLTTYTISFGIDSTKDPKAIAILQKTADLGAGLFKNTSSGSELASALQDAVNDVNNRTTSFTSANANSLQTSRTSQADAYIARFKPTESGAWEGHLFAAMVFDEFGEGCDSRFDNAGQQKMTCGSRTNMNPNINGDLDGTGKAICTGAFLVDNDCDPMIEDNDGNYKKGVFDSTNPTQVNLTANDANMWWDAGKVLSDPAQTGYKSAAEGLSNSRKIYTTLDVNGDGKLTAADGLVEFTSANAAAIAPALGLDAAACIGLLSNAHLCGASPMPACPSATTLTATDRANCASVVINFVRGWDVYDGDGDHCMGPGAWDNTHGWGSCTTSANCNVGSVTGATCTGGLCYTGSCSAGEQRDRPKDSRATSARSFWKLGDIFHSSPVVVRPPLDKLLCQLGGSLYNQCLQTIFSPTFDEGVPTPIQTYGLYDAYDTWRNANIGRQQIVLVGANDGMLHAFDAGLPDTGKPRQYDGSYPYTTGTGSELWAYIPPDLLPRLKDALTSHQYFVDGTPMVRDVWVDLNHDGIKQSNEFRTVAIISERSGGSRYTALDVTDTTAPSFLWSFPDGCTEDSVLAGETWADFLPRPPPIGPVRLEPQGPDPSGRGFDERWVVMLGGGYDPTLVRGRVVWMLDVYTGQKLWQYTDASFKAVRGDSKASMFPVPATIGMVDIGRSDGHAGAGAFQTDGMFDTATWGDLGGNIFLARMYEIGHLDSSTHLVTNWTAARTFEQQRRSDDLQYGTGRSEYFSMTLNFPYQPEALRVLLGSGNRSRMMLSRPTCGPDSVMGCAQNGCAPISSVGSTSYGSGSCSTSGTFASNSGALSFTPGTTSGCSGTYAAAGPTLSRSGQVSATCGSLSLSAGSGSGSRSSDGSGYETAYSPFSTSATFTPTTTNPCVPKRFVSFWAYVGSIPSKSFTTAAQARVFDANRFTDVALNKCADYPSSSCKLIEVGNALVNLQANGNFSPTCMDGATKCAATYADPGWMYTYGSWCPLGPGKCSTTPPWCDEQTGNQATGINNCVIWPSFRPSGAASSNICEAPSGTPSSYTYFADWISGTPTINRTNGFTCAAIDPSQPSVLGRGFQRSSSAVPQAPQQRVVVNPNGKVGYSVLKLDSGASPMKIDLGQRSSTTQLLYWLEVPKAVHTCRHTDPSTCK